MKQMEMVATAPSNAEGFRRGAEQVRLGAPMRPGWDVWYDGKVDSLVLRKTAAKGPAISYFCPDEPEVLVDLDATTGELVGVELSDFRRTLARRHPELGTAFVALMIARLPLIGRRLAALLVRGAQSTVTRELSDDLCGSAA